MIISKSLLIKKVGNQSLQYYLDLGYPAVYHKPLEVLIIHARKGCSSRVLVKCNKCAVERWIRYSCYKVQNDGNHYCQPCNPFRKTPVFIRDRKVYKLSEESEKLRAQRCRETKARQTEEDKENIKNKVRANKLSKYGDPTFNNQKKRVETLIERYGSVGYSNNEKRRETMLKNHGDPTYNNQKKKIETCLKKYGVEHTNQVPEIFERIQSSCRVLKKYNNLNYRGSYELDFLKHCEKLGIVVEAAKTIKYNFKDKPHRYYPDFYYAIGNLLIEIKSTYTMAKGLDINLVKKQASLDAGFNFMFIIDKNYKDFDRFIFENLGWS